MIFRVDILKKLSALLFNIFAVKLSVNYLGRKKYVA